MSQNTAKNGAAFSVDGEQVKIVRISRDKELGKLPPPDTERWVTRRKAQVVAAVRSGLLTFEEACERYRLSDEEFHSWMNLLDRHGVRGLRATRMQEYRPADERHHGAAAE
ncbi:MAG: DUF1153 domain-containing protein [Alphaproteobacteria bacterium]|nr:DUF1153 domain-containing protein [Alphaproteobacteria bacterium]